VSIKYFLDLSLEDEVINPGTLIRFRRLRLKDMDLLNLLINRTITLTIEKDIIRSTSITMDSTHSRSSPHSPVEVLQMRFRELRKFIYKVNASVRYSLPEKNEDNDLEHKSGYIWKLVNHVKDNEILTFVLGIKEKLNLLRETPDDIADHYTVSTDTDAYTGHKTKDCSFFDYKTRIAMSEERIITAAMITPGEKADGKQLPVLVETGKSNGMKVDNIMTSSLNICKNYLNEFCYKFNRRYFTESLFDRLLIATVSYKNLFRYSIR
jgi:hypothetical protein